MEFNKWTMDKGFINKRIDNYIFFDGVNHFDVQQTYDNDLTTYEYNIYKNSFIEIGDLRIELFNKSSVDALNTFNKKIPLDELELISIQNGLILKNHSDCYYLTTKNHPFDSFFIVKSFSTSKKFIIVYGIGGNRFPESIYIHGIWNLDFIPTWLQKD